MTVDLELENTARPTPPNPADDRSVGAKLMDEANLLWKSRETFGQGWNERWTELNENPQQAMKMIGEGILIGAAFSLALRSPSRGIQMTAKYLVPTALLGYSGYAIAGESAANVWNDSSALPREADKLGKRLGAVGLDTMVLLPTGLIGHGLALGAETLPKNLRFELPTTHQPRLAFATAGGDGALGIPWSVKSPEPLFARSAEAVRPSATHFAAEATAPAESAVLKAQPSWDKGVKVKDLAEPATGKGDSWVQIYREAFPPQEADAVHAIRARVADGGSRLYETRGSDGRVLTFSLFDRLGTVDIDGVQRPVFLNSYNATRAGYRGMGLGSKHMGKALTQLIDEHPGAVVPFEIDHTGLRTLPKLQEAEAALRSGDYSKLGKRNTAVELTPEEARVNLERLQFYERLGERTGHPARVANVDYRMPNLVDETAPSLPAHLLYFSETPVTDSGVKAVVRSIFTSENGYGLDTSHPIIADVLASVGKTRIGDKLAH